MHNSISHLSEEKDLGGNNEDGPFSSALSPLPPAQVVAGKRDLQYVFYQSITGTHK